MLLGADIVYHSATKYLGGHSDLVMGCTIFKDKELHQRHHYASFSLGANTNAFDSYLVLRSIKTLEIRVI